jgi:hypothetical protein
MFKIRSASLLGVGLACVLSASGCNEGGGSGTGSVPKADEVQQSQYNARAAAAAKEGPPKPPPSENHAQGRR